MTRQALQGRAMGLAAMLIMSSACGYGVRAAGSTSGAQELASPVQVQVINDTGAPVEVYAAGSGTSYRVGTVHPGLAERFVVRPGMVINGSVEFVARSAHGRLVRSGPMLLAPGDVVDFALTPHTATSTATVRAWVPGT